MKRPRYPKPRNKCLLISIAAFLLGLAPAAGAPTTFIGATPCTTTRHTLLVALIFLAANRPKRQGL